MQSHSSGFGWVFQNFRRQASEQNFLGLPLVFRVRGAPQVMHIFFTQLDTNSEMSISSKA